VSPEETVRSGSTIDKSAGRLPAAFLSCRSAYRAISVRVLSRLMSQVRSSSNPWPQRRRRDREYRRRVRNNDRIFLAEPGDQWSQPGAARQRHRQVGSDA